MQGDPVIRQPLGRRILVKDCPPDASHFAYCNKSLFPLFKITKAGIQRIGEFFTRLSCSFGREVFEVILVQDHAAILGSQMPRQLCVRRVLTAGSSLLNVFHDLFIEHVRVLHIALIEREMRLQSFIRDPVQAREFKIFCLVCCLCHRLVWCLSRRLVGVTAARYEIGIHGRRAQA